MKEYYVYIHYLVDNKEIFYVGKGTGNRAWSKNSRSLRVQGKNNPQYVRLGFNTGKKFSSSHKEKISNGLKKYKRTAEHSQNLQKQIEKSCGRKIKIILSEKELNFISIQSASKETGIPYTAIYDTLNRKNNYSPKYNFYAFYIIN